LIDGTRSLAAHRIKRVTKPEPRSATLTGTGKRSWAGGGEEEITKSKQKRDDRKQIGRKNHIGGGELSGGASLLEHYLGEGKNEGNGGWEGGTFNSQIPPHS